MNVKELLEQTIETLCKIDGEKVGGILSAEIRDCVFALQKAITPKMEECPNCGGNGEYEDGIECEICCGIGQVVTAKRKLKPCPFCGSIELCEESSSLIETKRPYQQCYIECLECGTEGPSVRVFDGEDDYQIVRDAWNKRTVETKEVSYE